MVCYIMRTVLLVIILLLVMVFFHNYARIKIDSYNSLPVEHILTLHNVIILIKSVLNEYQNHYYYNMLLEKCLYQLEKKNFFFLKKLYSVV